MAEERLRRNLDDAFDPGPGFPDALLASRTMAALERADRTARRRPDMGRRTGRARPRLSPVLAAALIALLLGLALGGFLALQHLFRPPEPAKWGSCGGAFQCTTVGVPLDYSRPGSGSIDVAVIRQSATDKSHRIGSLVMVAGGPGGSGVDYLRQNSIYYANLNRRFDLVAFDQRGSGRSAPVHCLTAAQVDEINDVDTVLDDPQEKQLFLNSNVAIAEACQQTSSRLLPFVDTTSAARDMDAIRAALGESDLTYLAFGYGTYLAQEYAHMFPGHVRAMVLDGVLDPAVALPDLWLQRAAGLEASLQAFLAACRTHIDCTVDQTRVTGFLQRVDRAPLQVGTRHLGRTLAIAALLSGLQPRYWTQLEAALHDAFNGDGQALLGLADLEFGRRSDGSYAFSAEAWTANLCVDRLVPTDIATYDGLGAAMAQASATFGPAFQYVASACATWPVKARTAVGPVTASTTSPILVVGSTHDPFWPYAGAVAVSSRLAGSVVLTRIGYGSISYFDSLCVRLAVDDYLTRTQTPARGTTCESDYPA